MELAALGVMESEFLCRRLSFDLRIFGGNWATQNEAGPLKLQIAMETAASMRLISQL
jgi:hypothetical protein